MSKALAYIKSIPTGNVGDFTHANLEVLVFRGDLPGTPYVNKLVEFEYDPKSIKTITETSPSKSTDCLYTIARYIQSQKPKNNEQGQQEEGRIWHDRKFILSTKDDNFDFHCMCSIPLSECPVMKEIFSLPNSNLQTERNDDDDEQITATLPVKTDLPRYNSICIGCGKNKQR